MDRPRPKVAPAPRSRTSPEAPPGHQGPLPWVRLRSAPAGPNAFRRMIDAEDPKARPGDLVKVYDKGGAPFGVAFFNPKSLVTLRIFTRAHEGFDADGFFRERLGAAAGFRRDLLKLEESTDAYRLVHDYGDGLPGLVVDRYGAWLVLEFYSLGMFRQVERLERALGELYPGAKFVRRASDYTQKMEGFALSAAEGGRTRIVENGVAFEVELGGGYKTGFFCDQRENRLGVARLSAGRKVLDLFGYTGGFAIYAKKLGGAEHAISVELDPEASAMARRNVNANQARVETVCVDAFPYLRQAAENRQSFGLVILDPYKLIASRETFDFGRKKYVDLNRLALSVVEPGGLFVTCSCSGLLPWDEFKKIVRTAAGSAGRRVQIFRQTGAGPDHPFAADYPEGEYLKCLWCRVA